MKNQFVYLMTVAMIAGGTAFAQSGTIQTPILDSYTADLLSCTCATDNHDGHGTPGFVRKADEMRAKAWAANTDVDKARTMPETTRPGAMSANEGRNSRNTGARLGGGRDGVK